jgi:glycolate oxidase
MEEWLEMEPRLLSEFYAFIVKELGGKISGEHGIGLKRRSFFKDVTPEAEYQLLCAVKQALDPKNIMNPGKILL